MFTSQVLPIPESAVNHCFADRWTSLSVDERRAAEWAELDALPASVAVPAIDPKVARQAIKWLECLPPEDRRRLIVIAAERLGIAPHGLPGTDVLKAALDRPERPKVLSEWGRAIDFAAQRRKPISAGIHRWSDRAVDWENEWLEGKWADWLAVGWHGLAAEVCRLMHALHPVDGGPDADLECMSPRGRGTRLMDVPEAELCAEAKQIADRRLAIWEMRRAAGLVAELSPADRREIDPTHWRRELRREARLARQYWQAALGLAWHVGARYCADRTLARFLERRAAAQAWARACRFKARMEPPWTSPWSSRHPSGRRWRGCSSTRRGWKVLRSGPG